MSRRRRRATLLTILGAAAGVLCILITLSSHMALPFPMPTWDSLFETAGLVPHKQASVALVTEGTSVHVIDVGQGQSVLVKTTEGSLLFDAGENDKGEEVLSYLKSAGVESLTYLVGTHPHSDHIGGMDTVLRGVDVENVVMPDIPQSIMPTTKTFTDVLTAVDEKGLALSVLKPGDSFDVGEAHFEVLAPLKAYDELNNVSLVVRMTVGKISVLLTGDAEKASEKDMQKSGVSLRADVLIAGHHGSDTSSSKAFLQAVSPAYAAVSCGKGNSYGHPHADVLARFDEMGVTVCRTDLMGSVVFVTDGEHVSLKTPFVA